MSYKVDGEPYIRISTDEASALHGNDNYAFIDVRRPDEYMEGHIKGAIFITVDEILARIDELPKDKKLLFICAAGVRSALACEMSAAMGINQDDLYNIEEGTPTWISKGYPTSIGADI
jgi:rhodanese-related sulfurtransferase|tara:strand:+ start:740 stop:1093 length:354 start_codon:yes stop_codon:yes gene_type:complete